MAVGEEAQYLGSPASCAALGLHSSAAVAEGSAMVADLVAAHNLILRIVLGMDLGEPGTPTSMSTDSGADLEVLGTSP